MADEKNNENENENKPAKKGLNNNLIIIILLVFNMLVMLGAAGTVFYVFINQPQKEGIVDVVTSEDRVQEVMGSDELDLEEEEASMGPTFPLDRFIVNLADTGGGRYLNILIDLELNNEELTNEIEKRLPQIRDTLLVLLSSKRYNQISNIEGKKRLRDEIMHTINSILTTGRIKNVYFTNFVIN